MYRKNTTIHKDIQRARKREKAKKHIEEKKTTINWKKYLTKKYAEVLHNIFPLHAERVT